MSETDEGIDELRWLVEIADRVERYAEGVDDDVIAAVVTVDELQRLVDLAGEAFGPVVAYASPMMDDTSVEIGAAEERRRIIEWLQRTDLVELVGRRTVSVASMLEVKQALVEALERGEHQ